MFHAVAAGARALRARTPLRKPENLVRADAACFRGGGSRGGPLHRASFLRGGGRAVHGRIPSFHHVCFAGGDRNKCCYGKEWYDEFFHKWFFYNWLLVLIIVCPWWWSWWFSYPQSPGRRGLLPRPFSR